MKIHYSCVIAASIIFLLVASACHNSNNKNPEETGFNQISNDTIEIHIGQSVKQGSPLFDIASSEYSEIAKSYIQSNSEMLQAERTLNRVKDLYDNHVASSKELEEAQTAYNIAREEYNHAQAVTKEYQICSDNMSVGRPMTVRSPIHGKILKNEIVIGEYLKEDSEAKVIIADLDKVWLKANISEKEAPLVNNIESVDISTVANSDSVLHGKIVYVGGMLDPETRTLQTIIECDNRKGELIEALEKSNKSYDEILSFLNS